VDVADRAVPVDQQVGQEDQEGLVAAMVPHRENEHRVVPVVGDLVPKVNEEKGVALEDQTVHQRGLQESIPIGC
jgi:hypothetical protein